MAADVLTTGQQAGPQGLFGPSFDGRFLCAENRDHAAQVRELLRARKTLYKDAIAGKGNMPPKGGTQWPDATIRMTVDYMVSLNK